MGQDVNRRDFVKSVTAASVAPLLLGGNMAAAEGTTAVLTVHFDRRIGVIEPRIFGHMTEETLTSYEGGVLSEMLYNRKFERGEERNIASNTVAGVLFKGTGD